MKNCQLHILCEGPTEATFASKVLAPYLRSFSIYVKPINLCTSKKKGAYGGVTNYTKIVNDLNPIFAGTRNSANETHIVTTMLDLYAIPTDMPGYEIASHCRNPYDRVACLEQAFAEDVNNRFFIPYIQLHEFEALLFSDISKLAIAYPEAQQEIDQLKAETDRIGDGNPELINHGVNTAPSKRIIKCLAAKYNYDKVRSGASVASQITLPVILSRCAHFREWIERIIALSDQLEAEK
ncbi:MAG: DUF4276 family protein [Muribaculum sp.]|nr:DUF4276 family protein [Muribaculum sp.]